MSPFRRLLAYLRPYRRSFLLGLLCVVCTQSVALSGPWVLRQAIDDLASGVTRSKLLLYAGVLLGIGLVRAIFQFAMRRVLIGTSRDIEYDIRNAFFAHLQRLPHAYFQAHRTGDLMSRATNDLSAVRMLVGPSIMYAANTLLVFVVAVSLMLAIDARLTLWALVPLPFVSISVKTFGSVIHRRFERIQEQLSELSAIAQEALAGVRVVRAYGQEAAETERFRQANLEYVRRSRGLVLVQGFFFPSMSFFLGLSAMLVLWLGSREVVAQRLTLGEFVAFYAYLGMLSWPMIAFGWVTNMAQRGMASWKRMLEVFDAPPAEAESARSQAGPVSAIEGAIEMRNLGFAFGGRPVLSEVSIRVPVGTTLALVGATGSGKSTLVQLLARLYDPPPGTIFVDGADVLERPVNELRAAIGLVPQEPFLFSATIADNIAFGLDARFPGLDPTERHERIQAAASVACLDKDVQEFPAGYDTTVGERGITLSGGQKQRTALARALAVDPRILVLDDALSAVDTYTEAEILTRLRHVLRARTAIIVAHRLSTVQHADHIVMLDAGRVVERGTHESLLARNGAYAALYRQQLLEAELEAS